MRHIVITPVVVGLLGLAALAVPATAQAATVDDTPTTFSITAGEMALTVPVSADLGTVAIGAASVQAQLGAVEVSDQRASTDGGWTASVVSSDFGIGTTPTPAETIPAADVAYTSGSATATTGTGTFTPGGSAGAIDTAQTAFSAASEVGAATVTFNPTITVTLPSAVVAGDYSGTITHSLA